MAFQSLKNPRRYVALTLLVLLSCLDPYNAEFAFLGTDIIVVEGFLNASDKVVTVKLSRTQSVDDQKPPPTIPGATITLAASGGAEFRLTEEKAGIYSRTNIDVDFDQQYRLSVTTANGRRYNSDPVTVYRTPPLDSITYSFTSDHRAIDLSVNARDATGDAKYFSWEFIETYEYTTPYASDFIYAKPAPRKRNPDEYVYRCWRTIPSYSIGIATTTDLSGSVIHKKPIISIEKGSMKLMIRYSILVTQRVIGEEEYEYLRQLKQTTEGLGGLFSPMPSAVNGNMHDVDQPGTPVLGYFSASETSRTRKFISVDELPEDFRFRHAQCEIFLTCPPPAPQNAPAFCDGPPELADGVNFVILYPTGTGQYGFTSVKCADCRSYGGVTTRPDFW